MRCVTKCQNADIFVKTLAKLSGYDRIVKFNSMVYLNNRIYLFGESGMNISKKTLLLSVLSATLVLAACSPKTQEKASETVDSAQADVAENTQAVVAEAQVAAQNVTTATQNAAEATANAAQNVAQNVATATSETVSAGANAVAAGANNVADTAEAVAQTAEDKAGADQQY